ncbi:hypothetical protein B0H34DRAFT_858689 [Crassisporium funariophilum]|nr:hypothetical protein B0H34DRAFT_858689 [Crassisporium funariophilum]
MKQCQPNANSMYHHHPLLLCSCCRVSLANIAVSRPLIFTTVFAIFKVEDNVIASLTQEKHVAAIFLKSDAFIPQVLPHLIL